MKRGMYSDRLDYDMRGLYDLWESKIEWRSNIVVEGGRREFEERNGGILMEMSLNVKEML